jgi:gephyrin
MEDWSPNGGFQVNTSLPGHILAQDVHAMYDIPRFKTTNVDGYALRCMSLISIQFPVLFLTQFSCVASDPPGKYNVVTSRTHDRTKELAPNSIHQINTGAALPEGTDGVLMVEGTVLISSNDRDEEEVVQTLSRIKVGENVRAIGSDLMKDERILEKGDLIGGAGEVGTLTFAGVRKVSRTVLLILVTIVIIGDFRLKCTGSLLWPL